MAARRKEKKATAAARVRHLLSLDAARVMARLAKRQGEVVRLFSRLRDRAPLLHMVASRFDSATFADLSALEPQEQVAAHAFHDLLDELRWYLTYTEDMPLTVQATLDQFARQLDDAHRALRTAIGAPHGVPDVVDAEVVKVEEEQKAKPEGVKPKPPRVAGPRLRSG